MLILTSLVFAAALYLSGLALTRIVQGAIAVARNGNTDGLMGLFWALGMPAAAWGLFYYLTR